MKPKRLFLDQQFIDRAGRVVYNVHHWPDTGAARSPKSLTEPQPLGQLRLDMENPTSQGCEFEPRHDLFDDPEPPKGPTPRKAKLKAVK